MARSKNFLICLSKRSISNIRRRPMKLYSGIDLHSTNSYLAIIDESGKRIFKEKLPNEIATITERLSLYSGGDKKGTGYYLDASLEK
jgi:hypothetical protein